MLNKINYAIDQVNDAEGAWKNKLYNRYYEQNDVRKLNFTVKEKTIIYPCGFYDVSNTWSRFFCNVSINFSITISLDKNPFILFSVLFSETIDALINVDLNNLDDSLEFTQSNWDSNNAFNAFISDSINRGLYKTGVLVNKEDRLMTLVTCNTRDSNKRIVILAKLINSKVL